MYWKDFPTSRKWKQSSCRPFFNPLERLVSMWAGNIFGSLEDYQLNEIQMQRLFWRESWFNVYTWAYDWEQLLAGRLCSSVWNRLVLWKRPVQILAMLPVTIPDISLILTRWYFQTGDDGAHSKFLSGLHLRSFSSSFWWWCIKHCLKTHRCD